MVALLEGLVDRGSVNICEGPNKLEDITDNVLIGPYGCDSMIIIIIIVVIICIFHPIWMGRYQVRRIRDAVRKMKSVSWRWIMARRIASITGVRTLPRVFVN